MLETQRQFIRGVGKEVQVVAVRGMDQEFKQYAARTDRASFERGREKGDGGDRRDGTEANTMIVFEGRTATKTRHQPAGRRLHFNVRSEEVSAPGRCFVADVCPGQGEPPRARHQRHVVVVEQAGFLA